MKRIVLLSALGLVVGITSCDELGDLIPDVDKTITKSFTVVVEDNSMTALQDSLYVNVRDYKEFKDYEKYVSGYEVQKITFEITDFDAPEDLYFSGTIQAIDSAGTDKITAGTIPSENLSDIAALGGEKDVNLNDEAVGQLIAWIEDPGIFTFIYNFGYEAADGGNYSFNEEDLGSTFTIKVNIYLTILTGFGN